MADAISPASSVHHREQGVCHRERSVRVQRFSLSERYQDKLSRLWVRVVGRKVRLNDTLDSSTGKDNAPKDYYTLESIVFLLKNVDLQHANYVKKAAVGAQRITRVVRSPMRLSGERHCRY